MDIAPSVVEITGLPPIEPSDVAGRSIWPLLDGAETIRSTAPIGEATRQVSHGIVTPEWRLIEPVTETITGEPLPDFRGRPRAPNLELYHRPTDPGERRNVAAEFPGVVADLRARMQQRLATAAALTGELDPFRTCRPTLPYDLLARKLEQRREGR